LVSYPLFLILFQYFIQIDIIDSQFASFCTVCHSFRSQPLSVLHTWTFLPNILNWVILLSHFFLLNEVTRKEFVNLRIFLFFFHHIESNSFKFTFLLREFEHEINRALPSRFEVNYPHKITSTHTLHLKIILLSPRKIILSLIMCLTNCREILIISWNMTPWYWASSVCECRRRQYASRWGVVLQFEVGQSSKNSSS
jgi:hypothetical protein